MSISGYQKPLMIAVPISKDCTDLDQIRPPKNAVFVISNMLRKIYTKLKIINVFIE